MNRSLVTVPVERVEKAILLIRGEKVMLDRDLAALRHSHESTQTGRAAEYRALSR